MASSLPVVAALLGVLYVAFLPVLVFLHELGHAIVGLAATDGAVRVEIGDEPERTLTLGRLTVAAAPLSGGVGFCRYGGEMASRQRIAFSLAGPAVSLLVCLGAFGLLRGVTMGPYAEFLLTGTVYGAGWQFLVTIVPIRYPTWFPGAYVGLPSDGRRALDALRG